MSRLLKTASLVVLCALIVAVPSVWAYWITDGVPLCTTASDQQRPVITPDGAGGAIISWYDVHIYAQRVNASGSAQWTTDGAPICTGTGNQLNPAIASDGAGGAIITWTDTRSGNNDIYAQRVNASGAVLWTTNGVSICAATGSQSLPAIASDGAGGAVVTWIDNRSGNNDIYAQRVNASGTVLWATNGVSICAATGSQSTPVIVADGAGGTIIAWYDYRGGANCDIYAQRVDASGYVQWPTDGVPICMAIYNQLSPTITSDGASGAIITWYDVRVGTNYDIYAQRVNAAGTVQWPPDGVPICTAANDQMYPQIIGDASGGAIITWQDFRNGNSVDIYAQRVNASGTVQWTVNGAPLCAAVGDQSNPQITGDGSGGAIVTWADYRSGTSHDIYAQRVNASGTVQWTANGVSLCTAVGYQNVHQITGDGAGGAIVTWQDQRANNYDVYAQQVSSGGKTGFLAPAVHSIRDVRGDQGGKVNVQWDASRADYFSGEITRYTIWRALKNPAALALLDAGASLIAGPEQVGPRTEKGAVRIEQAAGRKFYWELIDSQDAYRLDAYGKIVATASDSTSVAHDYEYFQVIAHTSDASRFYASAPDSGYSVDNLPPSTPTSLAGQQKYAPAGLNLTWRPNTEADLGHYAVYRGTSASFVPGPSNLVASPIDTATFDSGWRWSGGYYYKVSAVDIHGNESHWAVLSPDGVTGTDTPKAPEASYLSQNFPNPFNPTTRIAFGLSAPAHVSLRIYDAAGRLVRALVNEERRAGIYEESWDGRDPNGRSVASGIYFYRLNAGAFESTRKMILLR